MDPLKYINRYRARAAQRLLNPDSPQIGAAPWTQYDIEVEARRLGWEAAPGYTLAPDPRNARNALRWWRKFLTRYYRIGATPGDGYVAISHNFGARIGVIYMDTMLRDARIDRKPGGWPEHTVPAGEHKKFLERILKHLEMVYGPARMRRKDWIETVADLLGKTHIPQNPGAMP